MDYYISQRIHVSQISLRTNVGLRSQHSYDSLRKQHCRIIECGDGVYRIKG